MATKSYRKRKQIVYGDDKIARPMKRAHVVVPYLARDIIQNILAKLPTKSILRCKVVCKEWQDIIEDPSFAELHYQNSHIALVSLGKIRQYQKKLLMTELKGFKLEPLSTNVYFGANFEVVNSCRGFLLLKDRRQDLSIHNPLTMETMTLRLEVPNQHIDALVCGLGFSPTTQQYKVVTFSKHKGIYTILVTTIVSCECRRIHGRESILDKIRRQYNNPIALNASIHWLATGEHIARFDLDQEEFSLVASPRLGDASKHVISIGVLHGCLCVNIMDVGNSRHGVELWVMKEYGKTESWTQWCLVKNVELKIRPGLCNYKVMESGEKGKILVLTPFGSLLSYDLRLQESLDRKLRVQGFDSVQGMQLHFLGFFSLSQPSLQPPVGRNPLNV